ncbi:MAG: hypothetical protein GF398_03470 [Chitinivibrionales bacterium]|nr:hypothetical protein [Chitinivibrionales bacterium]
MRQALYSAPILKKYRLIISVAGCLLFLLGCDSKKQPTGRLHIVATTFPLYDFTRQICNDKADVYMLIPQGIDPLYYQPDHRAEEMLAECDVFIYAGDLTEPWAKRFLASKMENAIMIVDAGTGIYAEIADTSLGSQKRSENSGMLQRLQFWKGKQVGNAATAIWMDPVLSTTIIRNIESALLTADSNNAQSYARNAQKYLAGLQQLHDSIALAFKSCESRTLVYSGYFDFNLFARRYGLNCKSLLQASPEGELPDHRTAAAIPAFAGDVTGGIFYSQNADPRIIEQLAYETGAEIVQLHPPHKISSLAFDSGATYMSIMRENVAKIKKGLLCR